MQISAAMDHTCGVTIDQSIKCWGQLPFSEKFKGEDFMQVSTSATHTCGLHQNGIVECKGKSAAASKYEYPKSTPFSLFRTNDASDEGS